MHLVIVNPAARGGLPERRWRGAIAALRERGLDTELVLTDGPRAAARIAREHVAGGGKQIVVVGGDGTISETVDGCLQAGVSECTDVTIGVIPLGTGSDLARSVGLAGASVEDAANAIAIGTSVRADALRLTWDDGAVRHGINTVNIGLGGDVVRRNSTAIKRRFGGFASFALATVGSLALHRPWPLHIELDGSVHELPVVELLIANGRFMGGGMSSHPEAELDDGALRTVVLGASGRLRLIGKLPKLYTGAHVRDPLIRCGVHHRIRVTSRQPDVPLAVDGELCASPPVTIDVVPGAIGLVVNEAGRPAVHPGRRLACSG